MTDSRLPERYLNDRRILRLTDTQRSSYFMATLWSVSNRTDGHLERDDLDLIPTFNKSSVPELVKHGLWVEHGDGWLDAEFEKVQTTRDDLEVLENARKADREKTRRLRAHKKGDHSFCYPEVCDQGGVHFSKSPGDVPGTSPGEDTGQDRRGQESANYVNVNPSTGEVHTGAPTWHVAPIPADDPGYCEHGTTVGVKCRKCPREIASMRAVS